MVSRCLSAAGVRFLDLPAPTGGFRRPCGWRTEAPRVAPDSIGVVTFRAIDVRLGRMPSLLRGCGAHAWGEDGPMPQSQPISGRLMVPVSVVYGQPSVRQLYVTKPHQRFTRVHPSNLSHAWRDRMARPPLGQSSWLQTPPLPVTPAGAGTDSDTSLGNGSTPPFFLTDPVNGATSCRTSSS